MSRREALPLFALGFILAVSAAWWALALWPLPAGAAEWIQRTRAVCFGATHDSLPSAAGWSLLIGEPLSMLAALAAIWPRALRNALRAAWGFWPGRAALVGAASLVVLGLGAAAGRVMGEVRGEAFDPTRIDVEGTPRLDRPAPPLGLVDQHGRHITLTALGPRPVIVAFAYAHCVTVCPVIVHEALAAQRQLAATRPAELVMVTLDPWRDTPARLPAIAEQWQLGEHARVLSGEVGVVEAVIEAWGVPRTRDLATGEITHGTSVYLVDAHGRLQFTAPPDAGAIVALLERMR